MRIREIRVFDGRNIYTHRPAVKMRVSLGEYAGVSTAELGDFRHRLLEALPTLREHGCAEGERGGFAERLAQGTYLGHIIEHVAIELQNLAGASVRFGRTRGTAEEGVYDVVYEYSARAAAVQAGELAVRLVQALVEGKRVDVSKHIDRLERTAGETELGPSTRAIVSAAQARGIPVMRLNNASLVQLGHGKCQKRIEATLAADTSSIAVDIACDKTLTKALLSRAGLPVPDGGVATTQEEALRLARWIGVPVVVKPKDGNQGKGVALNLSSEKEIRTAFRLAQAYGEAVIVERYIEGRQYRVLVVGGRVVAASERIPACVVGDGRHSVRQLVDLTNRDPRRGFQHEKPLTKIAVDPTVLMVLARQKISLDHVPRAGQVVHLRENGNLSTGGTAMDVTEQIHPENGELAVRASAVVGLDVAGVDLVLKDISAPARGNGGAIIEVNAAPGIRMHHYPSGGVPRDAGGAIVDHLFPASSPARIPIVAVTGTNGKTTTARMIARILTAQGYCVGLASTDGVYIGGKCAVEGDNTGPWSARLILSDPRVEAAVLETARGGIIREGLGYDWSDVAVITNITEDHLGVDGVESLEDLAYVKSLVAEAVRDEGHVILNADDPFSLSIAGRVRSRIVYFTGSADNLVVRKHLGEGGTAAFVRGGRVIVASGSSGAEVCAGAIGEIPATLRGRAMHNVQNAVAAAAAACALGVPPEVIGGALRNFGADMESNPGRFSVFRVGRLKVIVDYGHNASSYQATIRAARTMKPRRLIGVIGVPGDRADGSVLKVGRIAGQGFDAVFIKEDVDKRGRSDGEVAALLLQGVREAGTKAENIRVILSETEAVKAAMEEARTGDVVVVFYEKLQPVVEVVTAASSRRPAAARVVAGQAVTPAFPEQMST